MFIAGLQYDFHTDSSEWAEVGLIIQSKSNFWRIDELTGNNWFKATYLGNALLISIR